MRLDFTLKNSERDYLNKVASLGCIICGGQAEIHHRRTGQGLKRANHSEVIPLCHAHHRTGGYGVAIHAGIKKWQENFGSEIDLIEKVKKLCA